MSEIPDHYLQFRPARTHLSRLEASTAALRSADEVVEIGTVEAEVGAMLTTGMRSGLAVDREIGPLETSATTAIENTSETHRAARMTRDWTGTAMAIATAEILHCGQIRVIPLAASTTLLLRQMPVQASARAASRVALFQRQPDVLPLPCHSLGQSYREPCQPPNLRLRRRSRFKFLHLARSIHR